MIQQTADRSFRRQRKSSRMLQDCGERRTSGAIGGRDSADINRSSLLTEDWCHVVRSWQDRFGMAMPVRSSSRFLLRFPGPSCKLLRASKVSYSVGQERSTNLGLCCSTRFRFRRSACCPGNVTGRSGWLGRLRCGKGAPGFLCHVAFIPNSPKHAVRCCLRLLGTIGRDCELQAGGSQAWSRIPAAEWTVGRLEVASGIRCSLDLCPTKHHARC